MDYNIYIHTIGDGVGSSSKTTPFQMKDTQDNFKVTSESLGFLQNPDSITGKVMQTANGVLKSAAPVEIGIAALLVGASISIADKILTTTLSFMSSETGDARGIISYNNFKQGIHIMTHPFSTMVQYYQAELEIKKQNAINEQKMITFGQTVLNNPNGRYL